MKNAATISNGDAVITWYYQPVFNGDDMIMNNDGEIKTRGTPKTLVIYQDDKKIELRTADIEILFNEITQIRLQVEFIPPSEL